ncbi:MAG: hypothetical protein II784_01700 [Oscillospiraceae bacterium]|nr:hypothetical protein [Oscillospiraceae bacterium]
MKLPKKLLAALLALLLAVCCSGCGSTAPAADPEPPAEAETDRGPVEPGACILINKEVDDAIGSLPLINMEHMSALFLEPNGELYFFFWGDVVNFERIEDPDVLESMDSLNDYLFGHGLYHRADRPYFRSVYIEGDFSASIEEARRLKRVFEESEEGESMPNAAFSLTKANCSQIVMGLVGLGVMPDGSSFGDYLEENGMTVSVIPNENMTAMQRLFQNTALNGEEYAAQTGG